MFEFELEKGSKKFDCPRCGQKKFVRYKSREKGEYLPFDVGRCDRESNCGYHKKPKEHFEEIGHQTIVGKRRPGKRKTKTLQSYVSTVENALQSISDAGIPKIKPDYIERGMMLRTLANYERNAFVQFLLNLFPEDSEIVWQTVKEYLIGTARDGKTIFWQVDQGAKVRTGKLIAYGSNGKRRKDVTPNWIHAVLKRAGRLKEGFNLKQCFFGEHLLKSNKPVAIVEAEKTAVIASICFPEFVWLAAGAKQNLNAHKLHRLGKRDFILYPDADGFELWREIATQARLYGVSVNVSDLLENRATDDEKRDGCDLADYLINEQTRIDEFNAFADDYNSRVEKLMCDENLFREFNRALDAQKANLILYGGHNESEAESKVVNFDNIRAIVFRITQI